MHLIGSLGDASVDGELVESENARDTIGLYDDGEQKTVAFTRAASIKIWRVRGVAWGSSTDMHVHSPHRKWAEWPARAPLQWLRHQRMGRGRKICDVGAVGLPLDCVPHYDE